MTQSFDELVRPGGRSGPVQDPVSSSGRPARQRAKRRGPGRNLPAAIAVGVGLAAVFLACLFLIPHAFAPLVGVALVLGAYEAARALRGSGVLVPLVPVLGCTAGIVGAAALRGMEGLLLSLALSVGILLLWRTARSAGMLAARDIAGGVFVLTWVPFLGGFAVLLDRLPHGAMLVLLALVVPAANDIGGYASGVLFGAHPMAPSISPKKSWEGFAGSLVSGTACATAILVWGLGAPWWTGLIIGPALVVISTCGDLAESLLKRDLSIKDMGTLLPGHGGVLDRIDSMLLSAPATFILTEVLLR